MPCFMPYNGFASVPKSDTRRCVKKRTRGRSAARVRNRVCYAMCRALKLHTSDDVDDRGSDVLTNEIAGWT